jgi:hypothetical protein
MIFLHPRWRGKTVGAVAIATASLLLLSGCFAPNQRYAADSKDGIYVAVPKDWHLITQSQLGMRESLSTATGAADRLAAVKWQEAFSPSAAISATDVLSLTPPTSPIVYIRVRSLLPQEVQDISYNALRDIILPITGWADGSIANAPPIAINSDSEEVTKGGRGIHTQYTFTNSAKVSETVDQQAILSNDHTTIYLLVVRARSDIFDSNAKILNKIINSFTVRGSK